MSIISALIFLLLYIDLLWQSSRLAHDLNSESELDLKPWVVMNPWQWGCEMTYNQILIQGSMVAS